VIDWSWLIARFISAIGSWLDSSNLRNRVYKLQQENEIMRTSLEDIQRMDSEGRMGWHAKRTIDQIDGSE
jgi:hypothetical protein